MNMFMNITLCFEAEWWMRAGVAGIVRLLQTDLITKTICSDKRAARASPAGVLCR